MGFLCRIHSYRSLTNMYDFFLLIVNYHPQVGEVLPGDCCFFFFFFFFLLSSCFFLHVGD